MLELQQAGFGIDGTTTRSWLLEPTELVFQEGQFWGLVGPNGSGKSTMLRLLSGEWKATTGRVLLDGRDVSAFTPLELARKRAVLSQKSRLAFPFTVSEVVSFGQFSQQVTDGADEPFAGRLSEEQAMVSTEVMEYAERLYTTLSGGEACRVDLARVLAQQTPILLLDEPTNHLDPRFQVSILSLCRRLADAGALVIAALHDLNLAARCCDRLAMLQGGAVIAQGAPDDVLSADRLADVYGIAFDVGYDACQRPFVFPSYPQFD